MNHDNHMPEPMDHSMMNHSGHHDHMMAMNLTTAAPMDHGDHVMDHGNHAMDNGNMAASDMDHGNMMSMFFHVGTHEVILFEGWKTHSWQTMLGSCIAIFFLATLYEGLKVLREFLLRRSVVKMRYHTISVPTTEDTSVTEKHNTPQAHMCSFPHFIQTLLHIVQIVVSYFLMLVFMTYNVYLCIAVAAGAGTGYFFFSWRRAIVVDINEHCH